MKIILITGISRGIGRALADRFLANGDFVIGTSVDGTVDFSNPKLKVSQLDLGNSESIQNCAKQISEFGKRIDIHINNAGVLLDEEETQVIVEKLRGTLEVNLIGTIDFTEQMIPDINSGGHIITISSSAGSLERSLNADHEPHHYPAYKISKTALNMYTRTLAYRLKEKDITVSSVHPGWVKTNMGGNDAEMEPSEAAEHIFKLANSKVETGQFWFKGEKFPW